LTKNIDYSCDRCGAYIDHPVKARKVCVGLSILMGPNDPSDMIHICDACAKELAENLRAAVTAWEAKTRVVSPE